MTPEEIATIRNLADMLRERGVRRFVGAGIELEFGALESPVAETKPDGAETPPCPCGHEEYEHNANGECLRGCEAQKCVRKEAE